MGSGARKNPGPGPQPTWSSSGARNQTLQSLERVLHVNTGSCLPHLLSHLCQNLGPGTIRLAARIYLQKGK